MITKNFIAAIELGSSEVAGMVGKKDVNGNLEILAYATENSSSFIRKGIIFNIDKAVNSVISIIKELEGTVGESISKIYVGIGGQSFRSLKNVISRDLPEGIAITEEIINSICDENRTMNLEDLDIFDVVPQEYLVGSMKLVDPVGVIGSHIEGSFLNIVARSIIRKNLERCFSEAKIEMADDPFIIPLITAKYALSESERRLGCALIDFGADVTTVSVYCKNILRFLSVVPLGGSSITHDLMSLNIEEDEAEELKVHYGSALLEMNRDEEEIIHLREDDRTVGLSKINDIVEARCEELIANVWNQIRFSGYEGRLGSGLIFTGGGSNLRNLNDAFCRYTKRNLKIRMALTVYDQGVTGVAIPSDGSQNALLGMLLEGKENCCKQVVAVPENLFSGIKDDDGGKSASEYVGEDETDLSVVESADKFHVRETVERVSENVSESEDEFEGKKLNFWKLMSKEKEEEDSEKEKERIALEEKQREERERKREEKAQHDKERKDQRDKEKREREEKKKQQRLEKQKNGNSVLGTIKKVKRTLSDALFNDETMDNDDSEMN